ncbi:zinc ribbon domain protein [bacterium BMS3Abin03]|nr:zinc ribbon domain protein [bacterium BMS3Abin03]
MPTYDYKCLECNNRFEMFQPIIAEPIKNCPKCGGKVKRLIGAGAEPIFKGTGFYQTDYKNSSSPGNGGNGKDTAKKQSTSGSSSETSKSSK